MSVSTIGIRKPSDYAGDSAPVLAADTNYCTGMAYSVTECSDSIGYLIETWHTSVGLTTWHRADTERDVYEFVSRIDDAHDSDCDGNCN